MPREFRENPFNSVTKASEYINDVIANASQYGDRPHCTLPITNIEDRVAFEYSSDLFGMYLYMYFEEHNITNVGEQFDYIWNLYTSADIERVIGVILSGTGRAYTRETAQDMVADYLRDYVIKITRNDGSWYYYGPRNSDNIDSIIGDDRRILYENLNRDDYIPTKRQSDSGYAYCRAMQDPDGVLWKLYVTTTSERTTGYDFLNDMPEIVNWGEHQNPAYIEDEQWMEDRDIGAESRNYPAEMVNDKDYIGTSSFAGIWDTILGFLTYPQKLTLLVPGMLVKLVLTSITSVGSTAPNFDVTLESILFNKLALTDVNVFSRQTATREETPSETILDIRANVAGWYYALRNFGIAFSILILLYIGINMAISNTGEQKAKCKELLTNWALRFRINNSTPFLYNNFDKY